MAPTVPGVAMVDDLLGTPSGPPRLRVAGTAAALAASSGPASHLTLPGLTSRLSLAPRDKVEAMYTSATSLDVCFLVDCTGSMGPHIRAVADMIVGVAGRQVL